MGDYSDDEHQEAIQRKTAATRASSEATRGRDDQVRIRLNDIWSELNEIRDRLPSPQPDSSLGGLEGALERGLRQAEVAAAKAAATAKAAAQEIRKFLDANDSRASAQDIADAIDDIGPEDRTTPAEFAAAVNEVVREAALDPGRRLPHDYRALDEACHLLAQAGATSQGAGAPNDQSPSLASTEVMRDVSHLTTLLLGSSPAFAEAMRLQSDAMAYSLAALNKVGDMQRQDALGLAITARAAAQKFEQT